MAVRPRGDARRGAIGSGLALFACLTAACAGAPPQANVAPAAETAIPQNSEPATASDAAPAAALAAVPAATGARSLVGLGRDALVARLGPASFVRRDGPAEVWRYRTADCFFEVFLYRDAQSGQRVAHVDARALSGRPMPADVCFEHMTNTPRS
jgi:hypothetical protein